MTNDPARPGYETRDASIGPLLWFAVGLAVLCVVAAVSSAKLESFFAARVDERSKAHPMAGFRTRPTAPLLQTDTRTDIAEHRAHEEAVLNGYQFIDPAAGIVRIPIEQAMQLLLERGLEARDDSPEDDA